ncbi:TPA: hypothetical protein JBH48_14465 [Legionella pneumophila]|nr:hypothetical protein [Legionella pneumophila]
MNKYLLTIHNPKVRELLSQYPIHRDILENGYTVKATNEKEARLEASKKYNILELTDADPSMNLTDHPDINKYGDLWTNTEYSSIKRI